MSFSSFSKNSVTLNARLSRIHNIYLTGSFLPQAYSKNTASDPNVACKIVSNFLDCLLQKNSEDNEYTFTVIELIDNPLNRNNKPFRAEHAMTFHIIADNDIGEIIGGHKLRFLTNDS